MKEQICPACGASALTSHTYESTVQYKGVDLFVQALHETACSACGYTFDTPSQHDSNVLQMRTAFLEQRVADKAMRGLLSGKQIRAIRERLELTQREAATLFGGGPVAFSKYESEDVVQSVAMDRLLRLVSLMGDAALILLRTSIAGASAGQPQAKELKYLPTVNAPSQATTETAFGTTGVLAPPIELEAWAPDSTFAN